jgi:hypothetical protein
MVLGNIACFGCSFTFGDEFPDANLLDYIPSKHTWINQIDKKANVTNYSIPGASCSQILYQILSTNFSNVDIVFVMWSFNDRITLYKDNLPLTITPSNIVMYNKDKKIRKFMEKFFDNDTVIDLRNTFESLVVEDKFVYNEYFKNIFIAQQYFLSINKPFYFTTTKNYFTIYNNIQNKLNRFQNDTHNLYENIDKNKFFLPENLGFVQWAYKNKYDTFPDNHLKEKAHIDFAKLFLEWINSDMEKK